jgi:alpha-tubulin suppressor-like RCC1 family protein
MLRSAISSKVPNFRCYGPLSAVSGINATFNSPELRNRVQENQSHFKQQKSVTFCSIARFPKNSLDVCSTGRFLPCKRVTTLDLFKKSEVISRFQSSTATLESSSDGDISSIGCKRSGVRNVAIIAHVGKFSRRHI